MIPFRPRLFKWRNIVLSSTHQHSNDSKNSTMWMHSTTLFILCKIRTQCSWKMLLIMIWMKWTYDQKSVLCHLILTKQKSGFSLIVAFQKILISLLMVNQCPLPLIINTQIFHFSAKLIGNTHVYNIQSGLSKHAM